MAEHEESVTEAIGASIENLSVPAQATFFRAVSRLTGGLIDIPAAYLERWSQSIKDTTLAKSTVSQALAKTASKDLTDDELTMEAVKSVYLPEVIRKTRNRIEIAKKAAVEISAGPDISKLQDPDDDWINRFSRLAEDASSERMQSLFAKILAGEMRQKESFSIAALRIVSELNQSDANTFQSIWNKSCGDFIRHDKSLRGSDWVSITRLRDSGILSPVDSGIWQPKFQPVLDGVSPWSIGPTDSKVALVVGMKAAANKFFNVINFTRAGLELGKLLSPPDYAPNLRELGVSLIDGNVGWIALVSDDGQEPIHTENETTIPSFKLQKT